MWANCESTVWVELGTTPSRWTSTTVPANITINRLTIQVSVVRALRHSVGWKAGTALEMASMPVIAVEPDANARSTSRTPTPSLAVR